jgi:polyisoprenoid-binding protein YceI
MPALLFAQFRVKGSLSDVEVEGTSTLHDWTMKAEDCDGRANFAITADDLKIESLTFEVNVRDLKSGKSGMDSNTYNALEEKKYPKITFKMTEVVSISKIATDKYKVTVKGELFIAGTKKVTSLTGTVSVNNDEAVKIVASKEIKMTSWNVDPPTAVMGTIKTGDDLKLNFNVLYSLN